jgi:hypothetical protein
VHVSRCRASHEGVTLTREEEHLVIEETLIACLR